MSVNVVKLEEQWTPTTVHTAFSFHLASPKSCDFSVDFPLPNLGWTFALSLTSSNSKKQNSVKTKIAKSHNWIPTMYSFRQHGSKIPWGDTFLHAQLSLAMNKRDSADASSVVCSDLTPVGSFQVALARTSFVQCPLASPCTLSLFGPTKIRLTVSISGCPFTNGLFEAPYHAGEADIQAQLVKKSGGRLLRCLLAAGNFYDVKFLTSSTRSTSGQAGTLHPTYASLSVLSQHVDPPSTKLKEEWKNMLAASNHHDDADAQYVGEISCQDDYEEFDSDFEDEDEASSAVEVCAPPPLSCEGDLNSAPQAEQSRLKSSGEGSISSLSSFELDRSSDQGSVTNRPEDDSTRDRAVLVNLAAHRTWHAFVWYCYTGDLEFSKLKSQVVESGIGHHRLAPLEDEPPSCSPKSMYRLADLVGDVELKAKALKAIEERMNKENILHETFSFFTSKYPDVRQVQLGILMKHIGSPEVKTAFIKMISNFGNIPHAEPVLLALCDSLARSVPSPSLPQDEIGCAIIEPGSQIGTDRGKMRDCLL